MVAPTAQDAQDSAMGAQDAEGGVKCAAASPNTPPKNKKEKPKQLTFPGFSVVDCGADVPAVIMPSLWALPLWEASWQTCSPNGPLWVLL